MRQRKVYWSEIPTASHAYGPRPCQVKVYATAIGAANVMPMTKVRAICDAFSLGIANAFVGGHKTFFGRKHASRIDYFITPLSWTPQMSSCRILCRIGRRLQMAPSGDPWDHYPLQLVVQCELRFPRIESTASERWYKQLKMAHLPNLD